MSTKTNLKVNILGASGLVGRELLGILESSSLPIKELCLFASENSAGEKLSFRGKELLIEPLKDPNHINGDLAFLAISSELSQQIAPKLVKNGLYVIDKSSAFRHLAPLIVPGVNHDLIMKLDKPCIIASPNCVATPLAYVLHTLIKTNVKLKRVIASTYQAVSGAGNKGFFELESQVRNLFNFQEQKNKVFDKKIAFNVLPFIPSFSEENPLGQTDEEEKVIFETKKVLDLAKNFMMQATCVRVPIFHGHGISLDVECEHPLDTDTVIKQLKKDSCIKLFEKNSFPTPLEVSGKDEIFVGRVRKSTAFENGISMWVLSDNLRIGAALNAVNIAKKLYGY